MKKNDNKKAAEAKASAAGVNKKENDNVNEQADTKNAHDTKAAEDNQWLEEELKDVVDPEEDDTKSKPKGAKANKSKGSKGGKSSKGKATDPNNEDIDALMQQAAEQLQEANANAKEWKDNYIRLHAEWDTYRRRTAEQRELDKATATEGLVTDLLPILDDFERSITYAKENGEGGLLEGVEAVYSKLIGALEKNGVDTINPEYGQEFNALEHQAVATNPDDSVYDESISSVMQKGYKMSKKVIRPAMVCVTTGGEPRPKEEDTETE